MKAIISNKIYLKLPDVELSKKITNTLTYRIQKKGAVGSFTKIELIKNYSFVNPDILVIPQNRPDLIPEGYEIEDRRVLNPVPFPEPLIPLRLDQQEVVDAINDSAFINAKPGWGKTFAALHLAAKLGQKTLIITHTVDLRKQWSKEVEKVFGLPAGEIGSGKLDIEDHFVVVSNIQSLVKVWEKVNKEFGLVILDEAHHCPASTFLEIINTGYSRYRVGLSGTMERLDGKHVVFKDIFGSTVLKPKSTNTLKPEVHVITTGIELPGEGDSWSNRMNMLLYDEQYQKMTATICKTYVALGHKVLVVADRTDFLEAVSSYIGDRALLITGSTGERDNLTEKLIADYDVVVASRPIFTEGISVNILSCVVMPQPSGNPILLEQLIARVTRKYEGKDTPVVVDMKLKGGSAYNQYRDRLAFYASQDWVIKHI